jgi:hypothetical protein
MNLRKRNENTAQSANSSFNYSPIAMANPNPNPSPPNSPPYLRPISPAPNPKNAAIGRRK